MAEFEWMSILTRLFYLFYIWIIVHVQFVHVCGSHFTTDGAFGWSTINTCSRLTMVKILMISLLQGDFNDIIAPGLFNDIIAPGWIFWWHHCYRVDILMTSLLQGDFNETLLLKGGDFDETSFLQGSHFYISLPWSKILTDTQWNFPYYSTVTSVIPCTFSDFNHKYVVNYVQTGYMTWIFPDWHQLWQKLKHMNVCREIGYSKWQFQIENGPYVKQMIKYCHFPCIYSA